MYHRILKRSEINEFHEDGMYVTIDSLIKHIDFIVSQFKIIKLKELFRGYKNNQNNICVLTFDDGWFDFYQNAFPILYKYKVPATVFLPTNHIGKNKEFWTDKLSKCLLKYFMNAPKINDLENNPIIKKFNATNTPYKQRIGLIIEMLKCFKLDEIEILVDDLSKKVGIGVTKTVERSFISWDEAKEMKDSGLISFGSHTVNHEILTNLDIENVRRELNQSRCDLLNHRVVEQDFIPFCYPNGNYNEKIIKEVENSGYHLAVTTNKGWNDKNTNHFELKRVGLHDDISRTIPLFASRIAGIF